MQDIAKALSEAGLSTQYAREIGIILRTVHNRNAHKSDILGFTAEDYKSELILRCLYATTRHRESNSQAPEFEYVCKAMWNLSKTFKFRRKKHIKVNLAIAYKGSHHNGRSNSDLCKTQNAESILDSTQLEAQLEARNACHVLLESLSTHDLELLSNYVLEQSADHMPERTLRYQRAAAQKRARQKLRYEQ